MITGDAGSGDVRRAAGRVGGTAGRSDVLPQAVSAILSRARARRARRIALAAAYGSGGLGALGAGVLGLLAAEAKLARRAIGEPSTVAPVADGRYGERDGLPVHLALLGDSSACGLGVDSPADTPGSMLAAGLAEWLERPVQLASYGRVGARSADLEGQVERALQGPCDIAIIMIGTNDVTHRVRPSTSVQLLAAAVRRLREAAVEVVVATCPDLGTVEPIAQPLREVGRRWSRQLAAAQTIAVVEAGGRTVSLGDILGPEFAASPREMFGPDRFHPSVAGYRAAAMAILPSMCSALGAGADADERPDAARGEGLRTVAEAAVEASGVAGTEVVGTEVAGRERGPGGRWATLRHRRRGQLPDVREADHDAHDRV